MKNENTVTILLATFILAFCAPVTTSIPPSKPSASAVTFTIPTSTATTIPPTATEAPTQIPTEVPIPAFMADFRFAEQFKYPDRDQQQAECIMDVSSHRRTNFKVANLTIISVVDCYLIDDQGKLQKLTMPVGMVDETKGLWSTWGFGVQPLAHPNLDFTWNKVVAVLDSRWGGQAYPQSGFSTGHDPRDGQDATAFRGAAVDSLQPLDENFRLHGVTDGLPDFPDAPNFVMPMTSN